MKIRKAYQGTVPENKILDTYSTSQTDTYSCNYVNKANNYSTTETVIGTWIDGKPLYRKIYVFGSVTGTSSVDSGITNLGDILTIEGAGKYQGSDWVSIPRGHPNNFAYQCNAYYSINTNKIVIEIGSSSSFEKAYVKLEYTKSTD